MTKVERYTCAIGRDENGRITSIEVDVDDLDGGHRHIRVEAQRAAHVASPLQEVLRDGATRSRQWGTSAPFSVPPAVGAHAELLLRAVKPLRRTDRIVDVGEGIAGMSREEASYWHAQTQRRHGLKALRVLLDGGTRTR